MGQYEGTVYTGVVGPESDYSEAWRSIVGMVRRSGDSQPNFYTGTKGYELRQLHVNKFLESGHDFLLMLDHDMIFAKDTLERLRSHKLPYVSGLYMRRQYAPIAPIWFEDNPDGEWPAAPFTVDPELGRLHKIGASGWGCILVHREVILAVRAMLKGEWEIIEDDMDLWPYDIRKVLDAVKWVKAISRRPLTPAIGPYLQKYADILAEELRPLRGTKDTIGSDIRFPFFAKQAGYQLWGDPDVRPGHILYYPLTPEDYSSTSDEYKAEMIQNNSRKVAEARAQWRRVVRGLER